MGLCASKTAAPATTTPSPEPAPPSATSKATPPEEATTTTPTPTATTPSTTPTLTTPPPTTTTTATTTALAPDSVSVAGAATHTTTSLPQQPPDKKAPAKEEQARKPHHHHHHHHHVVIVGAGFGGNAVVHGLTRENGALPEGMSVTMLDRKMDLSIGASWQFVWSNRLLVSTKQQPPNANANNEKANETNHVAVVVPTWPLNQLKAATQYQNVKVLTGESDATVQSLDLVSQQVILVRHAPPHSPHPHPGDENNTMAYDTLVLAPGVVSDASAVPGLAESSAALDVCNIQHVPLLQSRLHQLWSQAAAEAAEAGDMAAGMAAATTQREDVKEELGDHHHLHSTTRRTNPKTILMCVTKMPYKCPPVPFEVVSILDDLRREHGVKEQVRIILSVPVEFPFAGPSAAKLFQQLLAEQDILYWPNHVVTKVEQISSTNDNDYNHNTNELQQCVVHFKVKNTGEGGGEEETVKTTTVDLLLCTFPQRAPDFCKPLCLANGLIPVDLQTNKIILTTTTTTSEAATQTTNGNDQNNNKTSKKAATNLYAIGDACHTMFPKPNKPHPKAGEFSYLMGLHVADQILAAHKARANMGEETTVAVSPPTRKASCVAECGVHGQGVNVVPDFSQVLANPQEALPHFEFSIVDRAAHEKKLWINGYLTKFFGAGNYQPFGQKTNL